MLSHVFICHERISAKPATYISARQVTVSESICLRHGVFNLPTILSLDYASGYISEDLSSLGIISCCFVTLFDCHEQTVIQEAVLNEEV